MWQDILKLYKYASKEYELVGENKYLLILYIGDSYDIQELADIVKFYIINPTTDTLRYDVSDVAEALKNLAIDFNWNHEEIEQLFTLYEDLFNQGSFIEFKEEYLIHDTEKEVFAFLLKLKP